LSLEWKREGAMNGEDGDEKDDKLVCVCARVSIGADDQQIGKVFWEVNYRDRVMHNGKNGCRGRTC